MACAGRADPNYIDLVDFINCPLCNKEIVWARPEHTCKGAITSEEYVADSIGVRLLWTVDNGWRSYHYLEGDVIEDLTFADVHNWVTHKDTLFVPLED